MTDFKNALVLVNWVDSNSHPGWRHSKEEYRVAECQTAGICVENNDKHIVIALSRTDTPDCNPFADVLAIPMVAVQNIRLLVPDVVPV